MLYRDSMSTSALQSNSYPTPYRRWRNEAFVSGNILALLFATLLLTSCASTAVATPRPILITMGGATAMQPVLQALTAEYTRRHPNILFTISGGGSTLGEEMVLSRRVNWE